MLSTYWNKIIAQGVTPGMRDGQVKKIRLINGICAYAAIIFLGFTIAYAFTDLSATFYESLVAMVLYLITIAFNRLGLVDIARAFFLIFNAILFSYFAIAHGESDGAEYLLFCSSVASMLFFESFLSVSTFFLVNVGIFFLVKYLFNHIEPFAKHAGADLYIENHLFTFLGLFMIVYFFKRENKRKELELAEQNEVLKQEKDKSERLLLNILPKDVAEELKEFGEVRPRHFDKVAVLFTDFKSFTQIASELSAEELVSDLNACFTAFDEIVKRHQVEKIKTIGDSYMCAYGLSEDGDVDIGVMIEVAKEMTAYMKGVKMTKQTSNLPYYEMRIGIHVGPVVAGIVGASKFAYDIWGDTVNIASRIESSCEIDKINISGAVYDLVKDRFHCESRGKIEIKNGGEIEMYFVS